MRLLFISPLLVFSFAFSMACLPVTALAEVTSIAVWRQNTDGYHTYRIPALLTAADGSLLAFCEGRRESSGDAGAIDLLMKRSTDNGDTWSDQQVIWSDGENTCGNPCPVLDKTTGRIHLLMTHNLGSDHESAIKAKTAESTRTVWICHSDDHGLSWSAPREITESTKDPEWGWYATGPGIGIQIQHGPSAGRLVVPCDHSYTVEQADGSTHSEYGAHVIYSDDHGKTWQLGQTVRPKMNECQVVELTGGKLLLDMRSYRGQGCRAQSTSSDGGETWSKIVDAESLVSPVCQASILRARWPRNDAPGLILFSSPRHPKNRVNLTLLGSFDDAQKWAWQQGLYSGPSAYCCLANLADDQIGCLAEVGENSPYETITLFRVAIPETSEPLAR